MDADSWLLLSLFFIFVLCSGYFSSAETCFSTVDKMKIRTLAEEGNKKAKSALYVINNFESALTTILIGTNVLHIAAASIATIVLGKFINSPNFELLCTLISTAFLFLFSEMIPKSFARLTILTILLICKLQILSKRMREDTSCLKKK